ncbi:MAG: hypothetical protein K2I10_07225 [Lachnospiraceae bacterium]|nr:hypothetical protein [Lachnospiraceae bacterium]
MKNIGRKIILVTAILVALVFSVSVTSYAYTEEEKAQAKAWLSAHGYSPDYGGAAQAYQDYLDGKFNEELGITTEGNQSDDNEAASTEAATEVTTEKQTEHPKKEKPGKQEETKVIEGNQGKSDSKENSEKEEQPDRVQDDEVISTGGDVVLADNVRSGDSQVITDSNGEHAVAIARGRYDSKNQKTAMVIAIVIVFILAIAGTVSFFMNKKKKD